MKYLVPAWVGQKFVRAVFLFVVALDLARYSDAGERSQNHRVIHLGTDLKMHAQSYRVRAFTLRSKNN